MAEAASDRWSLQYTTHTRSTRSAHDDHKPRSSNAVEFSNGNRLHRVGERLAARASRTVDYIPLSSYSYCSTYINIAARPIRNHWWGRKRTWQGGASSRRTGSGLKEPASQFERGE